MRHARPSGRRSNGKSITRSRREVGGNDEAGGDEHRATGRDETVDAKPRRQSGREETADEEPDE